MGAITFGPEAGTAQEPYRATYREARRETNGWTARSEKRLLARLAASLPAAVTPDHLTALGFLGMLLAGAAYAGSGSHPWALLVVNLGLLVNWFGDSLYGTLARHRKRSNGLATASTSITCSTRRGDRGSSPGWRCQGT